MKKKIGIILIVIGIFVNSLNSYAWITKHWNFDGVKVGEMLEDLKNKKYVHGDDSNWNLNEWYRDLVENGTIEERAMVGFLLEYYASVTRRINKNNSNTDGDSFIDWRGNAELNVAMGNIYSYIKGWEKCGVEMFIKNETKGRWVSLDLDLPYYMPLFNPTYWQNAAPSIFGGRDPYGMIYWLADDPYIQIGRILLAGMDNMGDRFSFVIHRGPICLMTLMLEDGLQDTEININYTNMIRRYDFYVRYMAGEVAFKENEKEFIMH